MRSLRLTQLMPLLLLLICTAAQAQETDPPDDVAAAEEGVIIPADALDRGTPKRSGTGFLAAAEALDFETAAEYLDLRNLTGAARDLTGEQAARRFYVIFERADWIDVDELIDDPAGRLNDNLPDYRDSIGVVMDEGREVQLLMQKVPRGDGVFIWKISNSTVAQIPHLYDVYGYPESIEKLRRALPNVSFAGYELFKWVVLLVVGVCAYALVILIALIVRRLLGEPDTTAHRRIFRFMVLPMGFWLVVLSLERTAALLGSSTMAEEWRRVSPIPMLVTLWLVFASVNLLRDISKARSESQGYHGSGALLGSAGKAAKMVASLLALMIYLDNLGINITALLAGLGVGGIAVALALQRPIEDVLGAVTLYSQKPITVGDFCRIGTQKGTIEMIGLRTTRMRTLANTLIAIPNSLLAREPIDNISAREKILYQPILRLRYNTTTAQLEQILGSIRDFFSGHDRVLKEGSRVRFKEIVDDALLIEVWAFVNTTDWVEYLEIAEELNFRVLEIVSEAGATLSSPLGTLQVEPFDQLPNAKG